MQPSSMLSRAQIEAIVRALTAMRHAGHTHSDVAAAAVRLTQQAQRGLPQTVALGHGAVVVIPGR